MTISGLWDVNSRSVFSQMSRTLLLNRPSLLSVYVFTHICWDNGTTGQDLCSRPFTRLTATATEKKSLVKQYLEYLTDNLPQADHTACSVKHFLQFYSLQHPTLKQHEVNLLLFGLEQGIQRKHMQGPNTVNLSIITGLTVATRVSHGWEKFLLVTMILCLLQCLFPVACLRGLFLDPSFFHCTWVPFWGNMESHSTVTSWALMTRKLRSHCSVQVAPLC